MQNVFANRHNMHLAVIRTLDSPEIPFDWKTQSPAAFAAKAAELRLKVTALTGLLAQQQAATSGFAADKAREEKVLEDIANELSQALAGWFLDQGREADAAPIDLALSTWQGLRDTDLLAKSKLLHQKLTGALAAGPAAVSSLATYGLDSADATDLAKETADFERLIADPAAAISRRKSLTNALRPKFAEVADHLAQMDRLVLRFRRTEAGTAFAAAWQAARAIRDLGGSGSADPTPPTTPTT